MMKIFSVLFVLGIYFIFCKAHYETQDVKDLNLKLSGTTSGQPWPKPQTYKSSNTVILLDAINFQFVNTGVACELLTDAYKRYWKIIFGSTASSSPRWLHYKTKPNLHAGSILNTLQVNSKSGCHGGPSLQSDESYTLSVSSSGAVLTSNETWGAIRGLETFSQLIYRTPAGQFALNETEITDFPRFRHRGIMLDTSRHFLKKEYILKNLDAMALNKFNVFHWHIVDDQSFPYCSQQFPNLCAKGAYNGQTHVYTPADVRDIIEYARYRGIRVVVEFDSPGHTLSWGKGQPDLLTKCYSAGYFNGNYGPINPTLNTTFPFLQKFFAEVADVFPDHYIFLGGDEVSFSCWKSNPGVSEFMKKQGYGKDYTKLEQYYMQRVLEIVASFKRGYMIWQDVVDNGAEVANDTVVNVWRSKWEKEMKKVTKMGLKALLSACWYLDDISYGNDWLKYYLCDPQDFAGTDEQKNLVIGGEACLWAEFIDDTTIIQRLWPRAAAVGERLWSAASLRNNEDLEARMGEHRCRMVRRDFAAEEVLGPGYCDVEF